MREMDEEASDDTCHGCFSFKAIGNLGVLSVNFSFPILRCTAWRLMVRASECPKEKACRLKEAWPEHMA